jgi:hypothetical protein
VGTNAMRGITSECSIRKKKKKPGLFAGLFQHVSYVRYSKGISSSQKKRTRLTGLQEPTD